MTMKSRVHKLEGKATKAKLHFVLVDYEGQIQPGQPPIPKGAIPVYVTEDDMSL